MLKKGSSVKLSRSGSVKIVENLSEGGFAYVHRVKASGSKRHYALKQIITNDAELARQANRERELMEALPPHPNILSLLDSGSAKGSVLLLLELCRGSLADRVLAKQRFSWTKLLDCFSQIAAAVVHLHSQSPPIAHRDLKIENVLVAEDGLYKLCDFGSCSTDANVYSERSEILQAEELIGKTTTMMYRAPEMVDLYQRLLINEQVDVWALGCVVYTMAFCAHPFSDGSATRILNGEGLRVPPSSSYPQQLQALLDTMLVKDPLKRATAAQVLEAVGRLRQTSADAEVEASCAGSGVAGEAPAGWLMKKSDKGDKKTKGLFGGGRGPQWKRTWCVVEPESQRLCFFAEPNATAPLDAISTQSIVSVEPYTRDGKYPFGWSLAIKGSQKVPLLRPCETAEGEPAGGSIPRQEREHGKWVASFAGIEASNAAEIARAAARHSFRDLPGRAAGSTAAGPSGGGSSGGGAVDVDVAASGEEDWAADFQAFADDGTDPFATPAAPGVLAGTAQEAGFLDADWGDSPAFAGADGADISGDALAGFGGAAFAGGAEVDDSEGPAAAAGAEGVAAADRARHMLYFADAAALLAVPSLEPAAEPAQLSAAPAPESPGSRLCLCTSPRRMEIPQAEFPLFSADDTKAAPEAEDRPTREVLAIAAALAQEVFRMSALPDDVLAAVWDLASYRRLVPGALIDCEWVVAMVLLEGAREGRALPAALSSELVASAEGRDVVGGGEHSGIEAQPSFGLHLLGSECQEAMEEGSTPLVAEPELEPEPEPEHNDELQMAELSMNSEDNVGNPFEDDAEYTCRRGAAVTGETLAEVAERVGHIGAVTDL